jgi:hypothetical protein
MNMNLAGIEAPTYVTQDGDSVMGIALRQCGNEAEWRHILACNPEFADMLPDEYFTVGTVLTMPAPSPKPAVDALEEGKKIMEKLWADPDGPFLKGQWEVPLPAHPASEPKAAQDAPLTCDFCGVQVDDPWHTSDSTRKHLHQCDACHASGPEPMTDAEIIVLACDFKSTSMACGVTVDDFDAVAFARAILEAAK